MATQCVGCVDLDTTSVFVQQHHSVADPPPVHSLCDSSGEFTASDSTDDVTVTMK